MNKQYGKYAIEKIRNSYSIKDYLNNKNIYPVSVQNDGQASYVCPIHKDTDPSFRVWPPNIGKYPYENYKCFGCKSGHCIITLVAELDFNGSWGKSIKYLADKLNLSVEGEIDYIINDIKNNSYNTTNQDHDSLESLSLKISAMVNNYLIEVNHDENEIEFCEKLFYMVDKYIWSYDEISLKIIYDFIVSKKGLLNRKKQWKLKNKIIT